ncbi:NAD(P)-dependent alcohol dehydrogenase [Acidaminobacter sp. JC074]|uniref:NAD(P)-dependent alcohol dehydrogenase n=1 Tax=Acidaminobacter sp. JC074 TaxID=2530199 RepID=UPI001F10EA6B|nr:NAD(P)-dependent alcohol dehydrogenase [Acidaminobacter sp. JC074]MCH4890990.1 NAD(P)-dependent alcohol dehydrogenase [Acidaminobacter sp. JC074]
MKVVKWNRYGPPSVLEIGESDLPTYGENEFLVEVELSTVTAGDCELRALKFPFLFKWALRLYLGFFKPRNRILGQEMVGRVVEVGNEVSKYKAGDRLVAALGISMGGYGEYISIKEKPGMGCHTLIPDSLSSEKAVCLPVGGLEAMHFMDKTSIKEDYKVLINGAGGSIGTLAIQMAKRKGAYVTAVDSSDKFDMLKSIGADEVIDYNVTDFYNLSDKYDVIFDIVGKAPVEKAFESLEASGLLMVGNPSGKHKRFSKRVKADRRKVICTTSPQKEADLIELVRMLDQGEIDVVIDKIMSMDDIVKAHEYVEDRKKQGNILIRIKDKSE